MKLEQVRELVRQANRGLNENIAHLLSSSGNGRIDYDKVSSLLSASQQLEEIGIDLDALLQSGPERNKLSVSIEIDRDSSAVSRWAKRSLTQAYSNVYPKYYVEDGKLVKVGKSSDGSGSQYKKGVSLEEVELICKIILKLGERGTIYIRELESALSGAVKPYKINITVMALVEAGVLKDAGRGKYEFTTYILKSPRMWVSRLKELEKGGD